MQQARRSCPSTVPVLCGNISKALIGGAERPSATPNYREACSQVELVERYKKA